MEMSFRSALRSPVWKHATAHSIPEKQSKLLSDVAEFVHSILELQYVDVLVADAKPQSFLNLIVEDGDATFAHAYGCSTSIVERRAVEASRRVLEERLEELCHFCDRYRNFLGQLACFVNQAALVGALHESVNLCAAAVEDGVPSTGYFARVNLKQAVQGEKNAVTTRQRRAAPSTTSMVSGSSMPRALRFEDENTFAGGFAIELCQLLEQPVDAWLEECESRIEERLVKARDSDEFELLGQSRDAHRKQSIRQKLVRILCEHISMVGFYEALPGNVCVLEKRHPPLNTPMMEQLISECFDEQTLEMCNSMRETELMQLEVLRAVCCNRVGNDEPVDMVLKHRTLLLRALRQPPAILKHQHGFESCDARFDALKSIVGSCNAAPRSLVLVQLSEWRHALGQPRLRQLCALIDKAMRTLEAQKFPDMGFLPTLRFLQPPPPTWCDHDGATETYILVKLKLPIAKLHNDALLRMPASTERLLRLISLVWELLAYENTRAFYFSPGRVAVRYLRDAVSIEQVNLTFATMVLRHWKQSADVGKSFRIASSSIGNYKGADFENYVREAFSKLAKWNLVDLMSVISEGNSPMFLNTQWKLVDALAHVMTQHRPNVPPVQCCGVLGRALDVIEPIVLALRLESGIRAFARPHPLGELLRTVPKIREWDGKSDELILTVDDVNRSGFKHIKQTLLDLSAQRSLVHHGKLSRAKGSTHEFGKKRVFRFNGRDLLAVLHGELVDEDKD